MAQIRLAIIGSAGRKEPITHEHWQLMLTQTAATIDDLEAAGQQVSALVSGGAAGHGWSATMQLAGAGSVGRTKTP